MKKVFLTLAVFTSMSLAMFGGINQSKQGGRGGANKLPKELNLSAEQQKQVDKKTADYDAKIATVRSDSKLTEEQKREQVKNLRQEQRTAIHGVLTPEQQAQVSQSKQKRESKRGEGNRERSGSKGQRGAEELEKLNLTESQKAEMKKLRAKYKDDSKERSKEYREAVDKILTPEQRATLEESRKNSEHKNKGANKEGRKSGKEHKAKGTADNKQK